MIFSKNAYEFIIHFLNDYLFVCYFEFWCKNMIDYKNTGNKRITRIQRMAPNDSSNVPTKVVHIASVDIFISLKNSIKLSKTRNRLSQIINDPVVDNLRQISNFLKKTLDKKGEFNVDMFPLPELMNIIFSDEFNDFQRAASLNVLSLFALFKKYPANIFDDCCFLKTLLNYLSEDLSSDLKEETFHFIGVMSLLDDIYQREFNISFLKPFGIDCSTRNYLFSYQASLLYSNNIDDLDYLLSNVERINDISILIDSFYVLEYSIKKDQININLLFEEMKYLFTKNINEDEMLIIGNLFFHFDTLPFDFLNILFQLLESNNDYNIHFYVFQILGKFSFYWRQFLGFEHLQKLLYYATNDPFLSSSQGIICLSLYYIPGLDKDFDLKSFDAFVTFLNSNSELKRNCIDKILCIILFYYERDHDVSQFEPYFTELFQTVVEMVPQISDDEYLKKSCFLFINLFRLISEDFDRK